MSLTQNFISRIPSKVQGRIYLSSQAGYKVPRLQITSFDENPTVAKIRANIPDFPIELNNGLQWMTISDGQYSIAACLNPELEYMVASGQIKQNSIIYLTGYGTEPNTEEAADGRPIRLIIGAISVDRRDFPERIGKPVNLFDATTKVGAVAKADASLAYHALLDLTPRAIEVIQTTENGKIYTAPQNFRLQVTSIEKIDGTCWHVALSDGLDTVNGSMSTDLELEQLGIRGHKKNNLASVMKNTSKGLKVKDVIAFSEFMVLDQAWGIKMVILYNCEIVYKCK